LGSEHPKRVAVGLSVMKDWLSAAEVCPLAIFAHDTDKVADASSNSRRAIFALKTRLF
jgi:hypothetical protein